MLALENLVIHILDSFAMYADDREIAVGLTAVDAIKAKTLSFIHILSIIAITSFSLGTRSFILSFLLIFSWERS